jgi:hypothetical protein
MAKTVPKDQWAEFLQEFTERHLEEYLTVRLVGDEIGNQIVSEGKLPFQGVAFDEEAGSVRVILGQEAVGDPDSVAHELEAEELVFVEGGEPGEESLVVVGSGRKLIIEAQILEQKFLGE